MAVYVGTDELKNAYIGEYVEGWQPGANTIAYFPLKEDTTDHAGSYTLQTPISITKDSGVGYLVTGSAYIESANNNYYTGVWCKVSGAGLYTAISAVNGPAMQYYYAHGQSQFNQKFTVFYTSSYSSATVPVSVSSNQRHHIAVSYVSSENKTYGYIDGVQYLIYSGKGYNFDNMVAAFGGWGNGQSPSNPSSSAIAVISDFIVESEGWTAQEVADYYNLTKSLYGIS